MADQPAEETGPPRVAIILAHNGGITNVHADHMQLDVVIATKRKDGVITGRPTTMLATPAPELVDHCFELADPGATRIPPG